MSSTDFLRNILNVKGGKKIHSLYQHLNRLPTINSAHINSAPVRSTNVPVCPKCLFSFLSLGRAIGETGESWETMERLEIQ